MHRLRLWTVASSSAAPILLIGGWTLAQSRQPADYDPIRDTISALAARGATDRWIMTTALAGLGASYLLTAAGLEPAGRLGRWVLGFGGIATVGVAAFPQPIEGNSVAHSIAASLAFVALAVWPAFSIRQGERVGALRPRFALSAALAMVGLIVWFGFTLHGDNRGLAERLAAGAEACWPLVVALSLRRLRSQRTSTSGIGSAVA